MEETTFLGILMSKPLKRVLVVGVILLGILLVLVVLTGLFKKEVEFAVNMPEGELTTSVFDAQNMVYTPVENFQTTIELENIPFSIQTVNAPLADINGAKVVESDPFCFYFKVLSEGDNLIGSLKADLTKAVSIDAKESTSKFVLLKKEEGFINGCNAIFEVYELDVAGTDPRFFVTYEVNIHESIYENPYTIVIGCMVSEYSTETLSNAQILAKGHLLTLQYDSKREDELKSTESDTKSGEVFDDQ
ncbi:MAG: hypothetical protein K6F84_08325 [Lachnospiraceae bacterium]|nr:hypothetical protein [Lachnospiraceae bacterium]